MTRNNRADIELLLEERYDDLKDIWRTYNDDGARFYDIATMIDNVDYDTLLEDLDVSQDEIDAVQLGEASCLDEARTMILGPGADGDI